VADRRQTFEFRENAGLRAVIAGGGTGGHLFPGMAVAEELLSRHPSNAVLFIVSGKPFERAALAQKHLPYRAVRVEGIKGRGRASQLKALLKIPRGTAAAFSILGSFRPAVMLAVGGYAAGPAGVAARLRCIPVALHEQNIIPGVTNRLLALLANRVYVSFEGTVFGRRALDVRVTGNPVRRALIDAVDRREERRAPHDIFTVLILGGSQGAHAINQAVTAALPVFADKKRFHFIHQTGAADADAVAEAYRRHGVVADVRPFFTDMAAVYQAADLVVCRAGASTVAEITVMGKAAVFIPFPHAADNHQFYNARSLTERRAADWLPQNRLEGTILAQKITAYADHPGRRARMAARAAACGRPHAATAIVDDLYQLALNRKGSDNVS